MSPLESSSGSRRSSIPPRGFPFDRIFEKGGTNQQGFVTIDSVAMAVMNYMEGSVVFGLTRLELDYKFCYEFSMENWIEF